MGRSPLASQDRCCAHCGTVLVPAADLTELERAELGCWDFLCNACTQAARDLAATPPESIFDLVDAF